MWEGRRVRSQLSINTCVDNCDTIDGVFTGRAGVEKRYTALFKLRHFEDHLNTLDQVHTPFATVPWAVGGYDAGPIVQISRPASRESRSSSRVACACARDAGFALCRRKHSIRRGYTAALRSAHALRRQLMAEASAKKSAVNCSGLRFNSFYW
jgi:hypothetical protein